MKIAFIGQKGIPAFSGGVEKHTEKVAIRMAKLGHEVFAYVRNNYTDKNLIEHKGVKLIHLPSISTKHLDAISHTFLATMHALFQNYDIIHYQGIGPASLSFIPKIFQRKALIVATFHCCDYLHKKWGWLAQKYLQFGEWVSCTVPDLTITVSKILQKYVGKKYQREAVFIPNGAEVFCNQAVDFLKKFDLKEKKYIFSASRLVKHKGLHYLIEAFKYLEDTNRLPNGFKLVIAGEGFYTDEYVAYLKLISQNRESIVFTGNQNGANLEQLFSHAYLFVQPSESEGLSLALLEAMGYGLPVLASDIPENLEALADSGFTFESKNINSLKEKLAYLINNETEAVAMGHRAKIRAEKEFGWDAIVEKTLTAYKKSVRHERITNKHAYEVSK